MHICDEGAESENILPQTRDDGRQGANVTANVVVDGVVKPSDGRSGRGMGGRGLHEGSPSGSDVGRILCSSGLHVGSSGLQVRKPCVRLAHEQNECREVGRIFSHGSRSSSHCSL